VEYERKLLAELKKRRSEADRLMAESASGIDIDLPLSYKPERDGEADNDDKNSDNGQGEESVRSEILVGD